MWFKNRTLDKTITFTTATTQQLDIPRDRWIRSIMLRGKFTHTYGTAIPSVGAYNFQQLFNKIRVVASGNDQLKAVEGYRLWTMNKYLHGTPMYYDLPTAGDSTTERNVYFMLHFALNPANPFDYSALLPAHLLSSLDLYIDFGATASYISTTGTLTGTVYATVTEAYIDKGEEISLFGANKERLFKMYETEQVYAISAACSDYSQYIDIPVGSRIKKIGIFTTTSSLYSDAVISKYRFRQMSPIDMELFHSAWLESKQEDKIYYQLQEGLWTTVVGQDCTNVGFTLYDPEMKGGFLDTRGMKLGDLKFQMNTTPATGNIYLYMIQFV